MFNTGDKVTHESYGEGLVIYTDMCIVKFEDAGIQHIRESELKAVPKYTIGQTVTLYTDEPYTVLSDVFVDTDGCRSYVMRNDQGDCQLISESSIEY
jgi:hypothetical protein